MELGKAQPINDTYLKRGEKKQVCLERNTKDVAERLCDKEINTERNKDIIISTEPRKGDRIGATETLPVTTSGNSKGQQSLCDHPGGGFTTTKSSAQAEKDYKGISDLARALPTTAQTPEMLFPHSQRAEQVPRKSVEMQRPHREP